MIFASGDILVNRPLFANPKISTVMNGGAGKPVLLRSSESLNVPSLKGAKANELSHHSKLFNVHESNLQKLMVYDYQKNKRWSKRRSPSDKLLKKTKL